MSPSARAPATSASGSMNASASSHVANGLLVGTRNAVSYTVVTRLCSPSVRVVISTARGPPGSLRSVVTYGRPHQATRSVETPDVAIAMPASAKRPATGTDDVDSSTKMKGVSAKVSVSEESERILSRRKVVVSGP